jgi:phosphomannomutase
MAFLLDRMAETGYTASELAGQLPAYHRKYGQTEFEHGRLGPLMQALEERYPGAALDRSDGLKLVFDDAWLHVRASNTEPILRLAAEARSEERLERIYSEALALLKG